VAGERRWRAAKLAQLPRIPAVVRDLTDQQLAEWAVIENLQREDLNPIDRAEAFASLAQQFHLSHQDIAGRLGVDRSTIANTLRLLDLHPDIRDLVRQARLSAGHGRALLGLPNPESQLVLARRAVAGGWSVRMIEAAVRRLATADAASAPTPTRATRSAHLQELEQQIAQQLSTKVRVKPARRKGAGTLLIEFYNLDQFDTLLQRLGVTLEH
jgi:ParB family chromosome partitioning protein